MEKAKFFGKVFSYVLRGGCAVHVLQSHFYEFTETRGESMLPTLAASNDYVYTSKRYKLGRGVEIGDCIVALKPTDPDQRVCKRITGMPGDIILIDPSMENKKDDKSKFDVDNKESFNKFIKVPEGHCWVTGDNLAHSLDSRTYNSLPLGLIKGKIIAANDFNQPFWGGERGNFWGFRKVSNNYIDDELEETIVPTIAS
ncbi:Mitochondrial inner membrane protease subunit 1 [Wickerhamomyces ciferrii]|uniref:Mitochondrial inner membrane protease subunit n=1 Tax=Wickerhamomyces ciferrii (strain ATCC 14091 / BCRC 22168 / CBS 111 / JCM 3599 / NBRC 0793 / NRRL Y-1031 F-60-10) TaxID=1206466 RepID=K0KTH0_WICCF|nr:Mitochondrial inner membrane protease subunit 1 [Wickerhamomyces ciferrii]CCH44674.1 Mitochondrial inner membrane protease subunit 1 [Wickerhamomyces ciferrii]